MSLYKQFKTDSNLEKSGIVLEYGENERTGKPITITIARAGGANTAYEKRMETRVKPYRRQIQNETMEKALVLGIVREVYAETVVLGWENIDFPKTETEPELLDAPFTKENCIRLFTELPDLFADVQEQSQRAVLFRADILEQEAKN